MNTCPACGYDKLELAPYQNIGNFTHEQIMNMKPPYNDTLGTASYEVCAKCGFEFGNDDNPGTAAPVSFSEYYDEWVSSGSQWFDPAKQN